MWRASALLAGNVSAEGDLQLDEMGIPPAVSLPLGDVRLDVAGPLAIVAVRVETDKCPDVLNPFSVGDVNLPAPARRAEADGSWCCHLNPSSGLLRRSSPQAKACAHPAPRGGGGVAGRSGGTYAPRFAGTSIISKMACGWAEFLRRVVLLNAHISRHP